MASLVDNIREAKRICSILILFCKPMTPSQLSEATCENIRYISFVLKKFVNMKIAICMNPKARKGKIYTLTEKGIKLRRKLIIEEITKGKSITKKDISLYDFQELKPKTDISCYRCIASGSDRREFIKNIRRVIALKGYFTPHDILLIYRREAKNVPRTELYRALKIFVKAGILRKFNIGRSVFFEFTKKGSIVAKQI